MGQLSACGLRYGIDGAVSADGNDCGATGSGRRSASARNVYKVTRLCVKQFARSAAGE